MESSKAEMENFPMKGTTFARSGLSILCFLSLALAETTAWSRDTIDYAKACIAKIGVPVPSFDCSDKQATKLMATRDGVTLPEGKSGSPCDTPSHGLSGCYSGTRILKYTDTIEREKGV